MGVMTTKKTNHINLVNVFSTNNHTISNSDGKLINQRNTKKTKNKETKKKERNDT